MPRVIGVHQLELKPGVQAEDLERFFREEMAAGPGLSGTATCLMIGDKGKRNGKYLLLFEFDGPNDRARLFVPEAEASEALKRVWGQWEKLMTFVSSEWSDYVELYRSP